MQLLIRPTCRVTSYFCETASPDPSRTRFTLIAIPLLQGTTMNRTLRSLVLTGLCVSAASVQAQQWEALPEKPPIPAENPQTDAKVALGKILFFDPRLSEHGPLSCSSCHNVMAGGDDNRPNSIGMHDARGGRSAPTVWNAAYQSV